MAYTKQTWVNGSGGGTPISAARLQHIENGLEAAAAPHTHTSSDITNFTEAVQDAVAALLVAGSGVSLSYDDVANTLTITGSGGGGLSFIDNGDGTADITGGTFIDNGDGTATI